ncbi:zinc ribbon domain-containing protein [Planotetraspora phitsanulokensis]|nr:zinc ribbon domain-containing protein [Planotetraspora phitsanulokensis]
MNCASCGTTNPPGAQFCSNPGCGAYLSWSAGPQPGEPRQPGEQPTERPRPETRQPQTSFIPQSSGQAGMRLELDMAEAAVEPGGQARVRVTVYNTGTRVERFALAVTGTAARWATADPAELTVYPGAAATSTVTFAPPRGPGGPAGVWDFAVQAASEVSGGLRQSAPGTLSVARFHALTAALSPVAARGGSRTRQVLVLDNQGNAPEDVWLSATDPENELRIALPASARLAPGKTEVAVQVGATPATFGLPKRVPFTITVTPSGERPLTVEGTRIVAPRFGRWPLIVAPLVAAALVGGALALTRSTGDPAAPAGAAGEAAPGGSESEPAKATGKDASPSARAGGTKATPKPSPKKPPPPPSYYAGKGELSGGAADVPVTSLASDAKIFLTPDLTAITMSGTTVTDSRPRTGGNFPAAALRVAGREKKSFRVEAMSDAPPDGLRFSYLVLTRSQGTVGGLPYQAGSSRIGTGQQRVRVPGVETATPDSVIILTVRDGGQAVRIDAKEDGGFIASTLDALPAAAEVSFDYLVVDPDGKGTGRRKAAAGLDRTEPGNVGTAAPRLEDDLIGERSAVLLTPDATSYRDDAGLYATALADVCVLSQGDGFAEVEPFYSQRPFVKIPYDWLVVT